MSDRKVDPEAVSVDGDLDEREVPGAPSLLDHPASSGAIALAKGVPGINVLADFMVARVNARRAAEQRSFLLDVLRRVEELERADARRVDYEHVWQGNFETLLAVATEEATAEPDPTRLEYLARFVANYSARDRPDASLIGIYWGIIRRVGGVHCVVLEILLRRQGRLAQSDLDRVGPEKPELISSNELDIEIGADEALLGAILARLVSEGLIREVGVPATGTDRSARFALLPLGRGFIEFVMG